MKAAKRFLSMLLTLCMLLSLLPSTVFAANSNVPFTDVKETDWFYDAVGYVYENGMMSGTGNNQFSPNVTTTRGMIVTILYRLEGSPAVSTASFDDVAAGEYYTNGVSWAAANGIVSGYGNGQFGPNDPITREQMAAILYRYAQHKEYETTVSGDVSSFTDGASVSSYAVEPMNWAVGTGLLSGVGNNMLNPTGNATRAEAATILTRYCKGFEVQLPGEDTPLGGEPTCTVTFAYNYGNKGTYETAEVNVGETVDKPSNPSRSGYSFAGWYTKAVGGEKFDFDEAVAEDMTLYAHWNVISSSGGGGSSTPDPTPTPTPTPTPVIYTVTFDSNGGSTVESQTVISGECAVEPTAPTRSGYYFNGWYTDAVCTVPFTFTTPVTADISLYAGWSLTGSDDVGDTEDSEVTEDDIYLLSASVDEVLAESSTSVIFYVNSTLTVPYFELYLNGVSTGVLLYDDGDIVAHSDDIPSDGCYSGLYPIDISEEGDIAFTAKATVGTTDIETEECEIFVYYELTDAQIDEMETLNDTLQQIVDEIKAANSDEPESKLLPLLRDALMEYLEDIEAGGAISNIENDDENGIITFIYTRSGIIGGIKYSEWEDPSEPFDEGEIGNAISDGKTSAGVESLGVDMIGLDYITYKEKALLLCYNSDDPGWNGASLDDTTNQLELLLEGAGFLVDARYSVGVADFLHMQDYDYINVACHGTYLSIWTGPFTYEKTPVICTPEVATDSSRKTYSSDLKKHRIAEIGGTYYIRPSFFEYYYQKEPLKAKIVSLGCCKGAITQDLVNAIVEAGASAVLAYSDTVYTAYDYYMAAKILNELYDGHTVSEALTTAKMQYGADDLVWGADQRDSGNTHFNTLKSERAICNIYGNLQTTIHSTLKNGNFDSLFNLLGNGLISWKQYGDARSVFKLSGLYAQTKPKMAIISSGFGSMNDATTSCIYQTILIPEGISTITFSYDVVSEEPMEFVGTKYNDIFSADILSTNGTVLENLAFESVNTSTWYAVDGINFPGGDDTTYHTRWNSVSNDAIKDYAGQLVVLRFAVQDAGDAIYDTAVLIDSITIQ